jgi:hypothetical protein
MIARSRYGRFYSRGAHGDMVRTAVAVVLVLLFLLAKYALPGLMAFFVGMSVPYLLIIFLLVLGWPIGAMHDKRVAVGIMAVFLLLLALHIL